MGPVHAVQESSEESAPRHQAPVNVLDSPSSRPQGGRGEHEDSGGAASVDVLDSPFGHLQRGGGEQEDHEEAGRARDQPVRILEDGEQSSLRTIDVYKFLCQYFVPE